MSAATPKLGTRAAPIRRAISGGLSDRECRAAACPEDKSELMMHDGAGLYLRVRKSGRKSWVCLYGSPRVRVVHAQPFPELSLAKARLWAAEQRDLIRTNAADPVERARTERVAISLARTQTLDAMMEAVWEDMKERGQPSWVNTKSQYTYHTPEWARRMQPIHITRDDAERILHEIRKATPPKSKAVKAYQAALSAAYTRAKSARTGMNEKRLNPALAAFNVRDNPFFGHDVGVSGGVGKRYLTREETQEFIEVLKREPQSKPRDLLLLVLYTGGQRCIQLAGATITVEKKTQAPCLLLLDAKQKGDEPRPHVIPLQGPALDLLAARGMFSEGEAIFDVDYEGSYVLARATFDLCERLMRQWQAEAADRGVVRKRFTKKALRSTASTGMAEIGIDDKLVELLLSNGQKKSVNWLHYNRWEYLDKKRDALAQWERWLSEPAPEPELAADAGKVVPLRRVA